MKPTIRTACALVAASVLLGNAQAAEVCRWVDERGTVHYGDCPPGSRYEKVELAPGPSVEEARRAQEREQRLSEELGARAQTRAAERDEAERARQERAAEAAARKERCRLLQENLHALLMGRPVYRIDEKGERVYLDQTAHDAAVAETRRRIRSECETQQ